MGRDPWKNAADVWASKVHGIEQPESPAMRRGTLLEPGIIQWAADELGCRVRRNVYRRKGCRHANLDAMCKSAGEASAIEAKTSTDERQWGEPGTDQVPEHVLIQCHHQMDVADLERVYVAVLLPRLEFRLFVVDRCEALCESIRYACEAFWADYVKPKVQPPFVLPSTGTLALLPRERVCVGLPEEMAGPLTAYQQLGAVERRAKELRGNARDQLVNALGTADEGVLPDGRVFQYLANRNGHRRVNVKTPPEWVLPRVSDSAQRALMEIEDVECTE